MAMVTIGGIPVYDAIITDQETGMFKISLVDDPAVMSNFLSFDKERKLQMYKVESDDKRLVRGVVMRADFPIYRCDKNIGEYYIIYKAEQIRIMAEKYLSESRQNDVNLMHAGGNVEGVQMVQYFIKGDGISVEGFEDIAEGSLFAEFHITNDEIWEAIKEGTYKGFSLEGVFDMIPERNRTEVEEIVESLEGAFSKIFNTKNLMSKLTRFKAALLRALAEFASVTTDRGILAWDGDEDLKAEDAVYIQDAEGNRTPAEDGDYKTEDGKVIKVVGGKVAEIVDPEAEVTEGAAQVAEETALAAIPTDKGELLYEGEELKAGDEVFIVDAEGNRVAPEDGDYTTEDGKVIKVSEGKVTEIVDDKAEVAEESTEEESVEAAVEAEAEEVAEEPDLAAENEALKAENEALKEKIKELNKEIKDLKAMPMAQAAHEEAKTSAKMQKTGNKGLDRLQAILNA